MTVIDATISALASRRDDIVSRLELLRRRVRMHLFVAGFARVLAEAVALAGALVEIIGLTLLIRGGWWLAQRVSARRGRTIAVPAWRWLVLCVGVAVLSHLYMDWQGSYGWRPFLPWSGRWYYLDWVAIADVFDALCSERPYKAAWPVEQAYAEIVRSSGSHFDPGCVAAFRAKWPEICALMQPQTPEIRPGC